MRASQQIRQRLRRSRRAAVPTAACLAVLAVLLGGCADGTGSGTTSSGKTPVAAAPRTHTTAVPASVPPVVPSTTQPATTQPSTAQPATVHRPKPVNRCAHNEARQLVLVSVRAQHAWFCAHAHTVFDAPVTTGMVGQYTQTPTGRYHIQGRNRHSTLTLNTGKQYQVQYWIPFDAPLFGFHDSSWQHFPYGSQKYRTHGSHGCIHLPLTAMKHFYEWVHIGASVTIRR